MKKLTQKLVLSVITMALVVVALGTSTFAWFTLTNSASISTFEAQITAGEGIEVTLGTRDNQNGTWTVDENSIWYTVLPLAVINQYIADTRPEFKFTDLTSADGVNFKQLNWSTSTVSSVANNNGLIELPLTFRSRTQQDIVWSGATLGGDTDVWVANVDSFLHRTDYTIGSNTTPGLNDAQTLRVAASSAARVSIQGDVATVNGTTFTPNAAHTPVVYQAPAQAQVDTVGLEKAYNTTADIEAYDFTLSGSDYVIGSNAYGAGAYTLAAGKTLTLSSLTYGTAGDAIDPAATTTLSASTRVLTLQTISTIEAAYYMDTLTVRVWIEGWDADTFDAIFNTTLSVQLSFTAIATEVTP